MERYINSIDNSEKLGIEKEGLNYHIEETKINTQSKENKKQSSNENIKNIDILNKINKLDKKGSNYDDKNL